MTLKENKVIIQLPLNQIKERTMINYDTVVIGGGPAGLASAISAHNNGTKVFLIEREARLGGILKQCIHDGFGLFYFNEKLSGPEYAQNFIDKFNELKIENTTNSFVTKITKKDDQFLIEYVSEDGVKAVSSKTLILSTGCRERTSKQVFINGTRPYGVSSAGTAQYFTNILGVLPSKKCVILGSGDIGLIMARRLTLEGVKVFGVYEILPSPSGLTRNIHQCLYDYNIPLHLSHTITKLYGENRLEAVEIAQVDEKMQPIKGTEEKIECDALILSVGLLPENELAKSLGVPLDPKTRGPIVNENYMTMVDGVFTCGNAMQVNDLVDYVSFTAEKAGQSAAKYKIKEQTYNNVEASKDFGYVLPQRLSKNIESENVDFYFRTKKIEAKVQVQLLCNDKVIYSKTYQHLKPPEMEKISIKSTDLMINGDFKLIMKRG